MQTEDIRRELLEGMGTRTIAGYALENIVLDGKPFDFAGHNYLIGIYQDKHPYIVLEKGAQMGASIIGIVRAFYVCDALGLNTIYFFPTDQDVSDFSKGRVAPIIEDSPHLREVVDKADSIGLRQVGRGFLYFRGMRSSIRAKSIPADFIVFDELDEVTEAQEDLADQRINHSSLKWRLKLSTPTYDGYGIDRDFQRGDKRYWNLICKKCEQYNILEESFPDCVKRISETVAVLICFKCKAELDTQWGVWVPKHPDRERIRSYHISGLYSSYIDLAGMQDDFIEGRRIAELYRSKLGLPYTPADQRLTESMLEACIDPTLNMHIEPHCYMGVDQNVNELHVVIRVRDKYTKRPRLIKIAKVKPSSQFEELDYFMRAYDVDLCVIDGLPGQHSARSFASRFPGRVYLCYYSETQVGDNSWTDPKTNTDSANREWKVLVNRTEQIDGMVEEVHRREVEFPSFDHDSVDLMKEFFYQHTQTARVTEEDADGMLKRTYWKKLGPDHFAHANTYSMIAQNRYGSGLISAVNVKPATASRILYARHFEGGSRY